jgi:hypothetical protein
MDLKSLLLDIETFEIEEIERTGRQLYKEIYLKFGAYGVLKAHDDENVFFWEKRFDHAFFTSKNRARHPDDKSSLAVDRIARIRWIEHVIAGRAIDSSCYKAQGPGQMKSFTNRLYVVPSELFVVWLEPRNEGGWRFSSAYPTSVQDIRKYCRTGKRIWKYQEKTP